MAKRRKQRFASDLAGRVILDSGAVTKIAGKADPVARALWRELTLRGWLTSIPVVTLAEITTGKPASDAAVNLLLRQVNGTISCDEELARLAGILRAATLVRPPPSAIDALVASVAAAYQPSIVLTTDPKDLNGLLHAAPGSRVIAV